MIRRTWASVLALGVACAIPAVAGADTAEITQDGSGNAAEVDQSAATGSKAILEQRGSGNETAVIQEGSGHAATVTIAGDHNNEAAGKLDPLSSEGRVVPEISADAWRTIALDMPSLQNGGPVAERIEAGQVEPGTVAQQGTGHEANVTVAHDGGPADANLFAVLQAGADNSASLTQAGSRNVAVQVQVGQRNTLETTQRGNDNRARNYQLGDDNHLDHTQSGGEAATVVQVGDDNDLTVPGSSGGRLTIKQFGGATARVSP
jgi:hypothetical protein